MKPGETRCLVHCPANIISHVEVEMAPFFVHASASTSTGTGSGSGSGFDARFVILAPVLILF